MLSVTGYASPTTAGVSHTFTVTARDAYGNTATGYTGTVHFTSSDSQAVLPANARLTNGRGSFSATLKTAGTRPLTATDTATAPITGTQAGIRITARAVAPARPPAPKRATPWTRGPQGGIAIPAAAVSSLAVTGYLSPTTAGTAHAFSVRARDAYGNTVTGYTGSVHFPSSDTQAVLPA